MTQQEMEEKTLAELTPEKYRETLMRMIDRLSHTPIGERVEIEALVGVGLGKDGRVFNFEANLGDMVIHGHRLFISSFRDITRQRKLTRHMQQHQRMESLGRLAGGIAHDLNNILAPIMGYCELLIEDLKPGEEHHEYAESMLQSARRGRELVKQVLLFARSSSSRKEPITLATVMREAVSLALHGADHNIEILEQIDKKAGVVIADAGQMHQLILNLSINALHAMPDGGTLTVGLENVTLTEQQSFGGHILNGPHLRILVKDTGVGIAPEAREHIFEPFYTSREEGQGTGLGLSTVFGIVRDHGGGITVNAYSIRTVITV